MITTSRLLIRPFQPEDYQDLFEYLSNPAIYRFELGGPISLEEAKALALERSQGTDFWAAILRSTQHLVGHVYFKQTEPHQFLTWELGYIFNPEYHNQGYCSEAAGALVRYAFDHFGAHRVVACCNPENIASWRVMEKIGMQREAHRRKDIFFHTNMDGSPLWIDTFEYAILKEDI